ncbi:uncharacterized protein [Mytilus edulis]|uniref:uncharacterized protein n=1 Tax=Mytilus edulis TaxID=6550 RepID=UPI0039EE9FE0
MALSKEEENYVRLSLLLTGVCPRAVRVLFDKEYPPLQLHGKLNNLKEKKLLTDLKDRKRIINQAQWYLLFPSNGIPESKNFDITLMICLLRNLAKTPQPSHGFDSLPPPNEITPGADLARIKYYRNQFAHRIDSKMDDISFNQYWIEISNAIGRLGGQSMLIECYDLKKKILDQSNIEIMLEIKRAAEDITELKQLLKELKDGPLNAIIERTILVQNSKMNDLYISLTRQEKSAYELLQEDNMVVLSGKEGSGKTSLAFHLMKEVEEHLSKSEKPAKSVEIKDIADLKVMLNEKGQLIIFIDDPFGKSNLDKSLLQEWMRYFEILRPKLEGGSVFLILSIRSSILEECKEELWKETIFRKTKVIDLSSDELKLDQKEKWLMLQGFCRNKQIEMSYDSDKDFIVEKDRPAMIHVNVIGSISHTDPVIGFPQSCNLFFSDQNLFVTGLSFFKNARENLKREISQLYSRSEYTKKIYATMVIMLMNGGTIDLDTLEEGDTKDSVCQSLDMKLRRTDLKNVLLNENQYFIKVASSSFGFSHETILESILMSYADEPEWQDLIMKLAKDKIILEFIRSSEYEPKQGEVCVKLRRQLDEEFLNKLLSIFSKKENKMPGYFDGNYVFDIAAEINVIGHNTLSDKRLSKLLWKKIEEEKILNTSEKLYFFFSQVCSNGNHWLAVKTMAQYGRKQYKDLPALQRADLSKGMFGCVCCSDSDAILESILDYDISLIDEHDHQNYHIIEMAMMCRHKKCTRCLINKVTNLSTVKGQESGNVLHWCVANDWPDIMHLILDKNPELLNSQNNAGRTPVMQAAYRGRNECVDFFLVHYTNFIDFTLHTTEGDTILHIFVSSLPSQIILEKILSADKKLLNIVNEEGMTALMLVNKEECSKVLDNEECLKVLMKHKPDVSIRDHKNNTALHHLLNRKNIGPAIPEEIIQQDQSLLNAKNDDGVISIMKAKDDECFNCLLRLNADISLTDNMNRNILHYCSKWSACICVEIIRRNSKLLYQKDKENKTPIMILAEGENADCVRIMLKHDENLKYVNTDTGTTLLHIAARYGCFAICHTILDIDSSLLKMQDSSFKDMTPLLVAAFYQQENVFSFLLKQKEADVKVTDNEMNTLLHYCARNFWPEVCLEIMKMDNNLVNAKNNKGETPLLNAMISMIERNIDAICWLHRSFKTSTITKSEPRKLVHYASLFNEVIRLFISNGALLSRKTNNGNNILHFVAEQCHFEQNPSIIRDILKTLPQVLNEQNVCKRTPIIIAAMTGHVHIVITLLREGADVIYKDSCGLTVLDYCLSLDSRRFDTKLLTVIFQEDRTLMTMFLSKVYTIWASNMLRKN